VWTLGVAWRPVERFTVAMDFDWNRWASFKEQTLDFSDEIPAVGFTDQIIPQDWRNTRNIKIGFDLKVSSALALRWGFAYIENPVPENTLSPADPDADNDTVSIGLGYDLSRSLTIDLVYMIAFYRTRDVENNILSGTYENSAQYAGIGILLKR
jgi:long-chain fatty acid transport protein